MWVWANGSREKYIYIMHLSETDRQMREREEEIEIQKKKEEVNAEVLKTVVPRMATWDRLLKRVNPQKSLCLNFTAEIKCLQPGIKKTLSLQIISPFITTVTFI